MFNQFNYQFNWLNRELKFFSVLAFNLLSDSIFKTLIHILSSKITENYHYSIYCNNDIIVPKHNLELCRGDNYEVGHCYRHVLKYEWRIWYPRGVVFVGLGDGQNCTLIFLGCLKRRVFLFVTSLHIYREMISWTWMMSATRMIFLATLYFPANSFFSDEVSCLHTTDRNSLSSETTLRKVQGYERNMILPIKY